MHVCELILSMYVSELSVPNLYGSQHDQVCVLPLQNELSVLEFIHAIVETYDRYFESVVSECMYDRLSACMTD